MGYSGVAAFGLMSIIIFPIIGGIEIELSEK
jgi:hypothetical protein